MYSLISNRGIYNIALKEYIVDFETDIVEVPTDAPAGSKCFVIDNSVTYMLNHQKRWVKVNLPSNSGGGGNIPGGDTPSVDEVIYEGGVI
jgi:hypothetical protein